MAKQKFNLGDTVQYIYKKIKIKSYIIESAYCGYKSSGVLYDIFNNPGEYRISVRKLKSTRMVLTEKELKHWENERLKIVRLQTEVFDLIESAFERLIAKAMMEGVDLKKLLR